MPPPFKGWAESANVVLNQACLPACVVAAFSLPLGQFSLFIQHFSKSDSSTVALLRCCCGITQNLAKMVALGFCWTFVLRKLHSNTKVSIVLIPTLQTGKPRCRKGNSWPQITVCTNSSPPCCWLSSCTGVTKEYMLFSSLCMMKLCTKGLTCNSHTLL